MNRLPYIEKETLQMRLSEGSCDEHIILDYPGELNLTARGLVNEKGNGEENGGDGM